MFTKIVLVCFLAAFVLAEQDLLDKGEKQQQQDTLVRKTINKNIVDYTERVQQQKQPIWQQYKPDISFTRNSEGVIQKIVRLPGNPFFQGIRVNVKPYPGGYVAIRANGAEIVKPFTATPDTTEKDEEIIIESQTPEEQLQEQIRQQQQLQQQQQIFQQLLQQQRGYQQRYFNPQQQQDYLTRYPTWSRFLQPQQQQIRYQQQTPFGEDIYNQQDQQGEYDRAVRDTKKDKKNKGEKQQEQQEKYDEREDLYRVPLYYQQYQRVPLQIYDQQYMPQFQGPFPNQLLNRLMGYQQYEQQYPYYYEQQYPYYQQRQYQVPAYGY